MSELRRSDWRTITVVRWRETTVLVAPLEGGRAAVRVTDVEAEAMVMPRTVYMLDAPTAGIATPQIEAVPSGPARAVRRVSGIDANFPVFGTPTTVTVRNNFAAAKAEIEELQAGKLDLVGGSMSGEIVFGPVQRIDGGTF